MGAVRYGACQSTVPRRLVARATSLRTTLSSRFARWRDVDHYFDRLVRALVDRDFGMKAGGNVIGRQPSFQRRLSFPAVDIGTVPARNQAIASLECRYGE